MENTKPEIEFSKRRMVERPFEIQFRLTRQQLCIANGLIYVLPDDIRPFPSLHCPSNPSETEKTFEAKTEKHKQV